VFLLLWAFQVIVGGYIGNSRGRMTAGILVSMPLGIVGWLIILCIPRSHENKVQREMERMRVVAEARQGYPPPEYRLRQDDEAADSLLERGEQP
jgi:hypothetical protein